jgi:alkylglycerol monooxygenase
MLLAIALVIARSQRVPVAARERALLLAGLAFSLAGDVLLMLPAYFVPGLVGFLIAHLCYIALFRQRVRWFPSPRALVGTLAFGAAMYAFLFAHLGPVLKVAVAAYVVVISLMAAQAIGRALVLRDRGALAVAVGSSLFMLSDSLLAVNRFALPVPLAGLWVLATYYAAQILIARNALTAATQAPPQPLAATALAPGR